eukprot:TRINITY_DN6778_c0_g1_i27.p1 TRINITY_DN6778_c0_g1~~TRINITY_DN6778_c0_g1_i27.p1  ORF type:complete len:231 (-),score=71.80 TRINITY_DN6778_c0_g1_i27:61-753(-)
MAMLVFFFSSRRRHTRCSGVSWARRCVQETGIEILPRLICAFVNREITEAEPVKTEEIQVAQYTGELDYEQMKNFAEMFIEMKGGFANRKTIDQVKYQSDFDRLCIKKGGLCLIALLNGSPSEENQKKIENLIEEMKSVKARFAQNPINFMWIDARCHSSLLKHFQLQTEYLPTAIIYSPSRKFYSNLVGIFDKDSLRLFVENALKGRIAQYPLKDQIEIDEQDLSLIHI